MGSVPHILLLSANAASARAYAVEGFGEAEPPKINIFPHLTGGFAASQVGEKQSLGGMLSLQTVL